MLNNIRMFLAYAIRVEQEAALRFDELSDAANSYGKSDVAEFFRQLANFSRMHLGQAMERGGYREVPTIKPGDFVWPEGVSPESADIWGACSHVDIHQALELALKAEQGGLDFYRAVFEQTKDPEIRVLAEEFVAEETEHVKAIEAWIARISG